MKGAKYVWPPRFFTSNAHLATRNLKFRTKIWRKPFFGLHLNLGAKIRAEIELVSLTKLRKNISLPRNLLNQQKIDAYVYVHNIKQQEYSTGVSIILV